MLAQRAGTGGEEHAVQQLDRLWRRTKIGEFHAGPRRVFDRAALGSLVNLKAGCDIRRTPRAPADMARIGGGMSHYTDQVEPGQRFVDPQCQKIIVNEHVVMNKHEQHLIGDRTQCVVVNRRQAVAVVEGDAPV